MRRFGSCILVQVLLATLITAMFPGAGSTQTDAAWIDVLSVRIDANGLIIIVCRGAGDAVLAGGSYESRAAQITAKDGTIVSLVAGADEFGIEDVSVGRDGKIILQSTRTAGEKASPKFLPPGEYRFDGGSGHDVTRTPVVTGFRVRDGAVVAATLAR